MFLQQMRDVDDVRFAQPVYRGHHVPVPGPLLDHRRGEVLRLPLQHGIDVGEYRFRPHDRFRTGLIELHVGQVVRIEFLDDVPGLGVAARIQHGRHCFRHPSHHQVFVEEIHGHLVDGCVQGLSGTVCLGDDAVHPEIPVIEELVEGQRGHRNLIDLSHGEQEFLLQTPALLPLDPDADHGTGYDDGYLPAVLTEIFHERNHRRAFLRLVKDH